MTTIRVYLIDEHPCILAWAMEAIQRSTDLTVAGAETDMSRGLLAIQSLEPDVVVVDVTAKTFGSIEFRNRIEMTRRMPEVVALASVPRSTYVQRAYASGFKGFVLKRSEPEILLASIRAVHAKEIYLDPSLEAPPCIDRPTGARADATEEAREGSREELAALRLMALGFHDGEIERALGIDAWKVARIRVGTAHENAWRADGITWRLVDMQGWTGVVH